MYLMNLFVLLSEVPWANGGGAIGAGLAAIGAHAKPWREAG